MASTYSSNLKLQLMGTGDNAGTWGAVTNVNLGTALEESIAGTVDVAFSSSDITLTLTDDNTAQAARNMRLNLTGTSGGARNLIVPAIEKMYVVNNGLADACTVKVSGQTGVSVPAGKTTLLFNNGTDIVNAINALADLAVDTDTLYVDSTNNRVGIGTSSPAEPLHVIGTIRSNTSSTGDFNFYATSTGGGAYRIYPDDATTANPTWLYQSNSSEDQAWVIGGVERMRIDSSGNVGIGTASPAATVDVSGNARGAVTTDNDLSFDLSVGNNFSCTPTGAGTLTFTNHLSGQSGFVLLDNSGGHAIAAAATTKINAADLTAISTAGVYTLSYFDNGTNAYVSVSRSFA
jgi:hypothetical protein